jgi:hypothetical protein
LSVLASAVSSPLRYGTTPPGSFQAIPETTSAQALEEGTTYHVVALRDVGVLVTSCLFELGEPITEVEHVDPSVCDGESGRRAFVLPRELTLPTGMRKLSLVVLRGMRQNRFA